MTAGGGVDVLAVLDRLIGNTRTMVGLTGMGRDHLREGEKARDLIAELIAADREYDEARLAFFNCRLGDIDAADAARDAATARRASALAALVQN